MSTALIYKRIISEREPGSTPKSLHQTTAIDTWPYVLVCPEGASICHQVHGPLMHRCPGEYQREFLRDYEPDLAFYVSESLRSQLHELDRTASTQQPAGTYTSDILNRLFVASHGSHPA